MKDYETLKNDIIKELIVDTEYADFLCGRNLSDAQMIDLICCAPLPLTRKAEMLNNLSAFQGETKKVLSYKTYYDIIQKALDGLKLKDDEIFLCVGKTRENGEERQSEAFPSRSLSHVLSIVMEKTIEGKECSDDYCDWYELEKWHTATKEDAKREYLCGDMTKNPFYTYTFVNGEICYLNILRENCKNDQEEIEEKFSLFYSGSSLNLPTPYKEGDILEIDGTPFAPKTRVVVLNSREENDCCFPCCLYLTDDGVDAGALKHSHIYKNTPFDNISPLYTVKRFSGELTEEESILKSVSDFIKGNKERGEKIFEMAVREEKNKGEKDIDALRKFLCESI